MIGRSWEYGIYTICATAAMAIVCYLFSLNRPEHQRHTEIVEEATERPMRMMVNFVRQIPINSLFDDRNLASLNIAINNTNSNSNSLHMINAARLTKQTPTSTDNSNGDALSFGPMMYHQLFKKRFLHEVETEIARIEAAEWDKPQWSRTIEAGI